MEGRGKESTMTLSSRLRWRAGGRGGRSRDFGGRGVWGGGEAERQVKSQKGKTASGLCGVVGHRFNKGRRQITGSMASIFRRFVERSAAVMARNSARIPM